MAAIAVHFSAWPLPAEAADAIVEAIRTGTDDERLAALRKLRFSGCDRSCRQELFAVFADRRLPSSVREDAFGELCEFGDVNDWSLGSLTTIARDRSEPNKIRTAACLALALMARANLDDPRSVEILVKLLAASTETVEVREQAAVLLCNLGGHARKSRRALLSVLANREEAADLRLAVATNISVRPLLHPSERRTIELALLGIIREPDESVHLRVSSADSLKMLVQGPREPSDDTVDAELDTSSLLRCLLDRNEHRSVRDAVGSLLWWLPPSRAVTGAAVKILAGKDAFLHEQAVRILGRIDQFDPRGVAALAVVWLDKDRSKVVRDAAGEGLGDVARSLWGRLVPSTIRTPIPQHRS